MLLALLSAGSLRVYLHLFVPNAADALVFAVVANVSIASLNLSLLVNSVGFYQVRTQSARQRCTRPRISTMGHSSRALLVEYFGSLQPQCSLALNGNTSVRVGCYLHQFTSISRSLIVAMTAKGFCLDSQTCQMHLCGVSEALQAA